MHRVHGHSAVAKVARAFGTGESETLKRRLFAVERCVGEYERRKGRLGCVNRNHRPTTAAHIEVFYHCSRCLVDWVNTGPIDGLCTCGAEVADGPIPAHESSGGDSDDSWANGAVPAGPRTVRTLHCLPAWMRSLLSTAVDADKRHAVERWWRQLSISFTSS